MGDSGKVEGAGESTRVGTEIEGDIVITTGWFLSSEPSPSWVGISVVDSDGDELSPGLLGFSVKRYAKVSATVGSFVGIALSSTTVGSMVCEIGEAVGKASASTIGYSYT